MGRRLRWFWHIIKKFLKIAAVLTVVLVARSWYMNSYDAAIEARAVNVIYPQMQQVGWQGVESFMKASGQRTVVFVYSSQSIISRWYFDDFNKIAADYAAYGVRPLFISVDESATDLARYLASKGNLYFVPYYMPPSESRYIRDVMARAGGDFFAGALPFMATVDHVMFMRSYSIGMMRTGKVREILNQSLVAGRGR